MRLYGLLFSWNPLKIRHFGILGGNYKDKLQGYEPWKKRNNLKGGKNHEQRKAY
jgi:hypothetical protein|nr:MAG TPA: hypothetical protein [Caudoviricetes sp.]